MVTVGQCCLRMHMKGQGLNSSPTAVATSNHPTFSFATILECTLVLLRS
jgi:hypothetical protein